MPRPPDIVLSDEDFANFRGANAAASLKRGPKPSAQPAKLPVLRQKRPAGPWAEPGSSAPRHQPPANGTVAVNDNGTPANTADDFVVYTPAADFNGTDTFTYTVTSNGTTETGTVSVTVTPAPDAVNDTATTNEDTQVNILVQANDTFGGTPAMFGYTLENGWLQADPMQVPAGDMDLLTVVMHEMGHALGLDDTYAAADRGDLMFGLLVTGERRLPDAAALLSGTGDGSELEAPVAQQMA
jgi:Bacterial Ig domain